MVIGLALIGWVIVCIRRGRFPARAGFRREYFLRGHDGIGFWLVSLFYAALGIAMVVAAIFKS